MQKIGIIGGAGPLASALLYETLVHESYQQRLQVPEIILLNYPFSRGLTLDERKDNEQKIQHELIYCLEALVKHGVNVAVIACNTLHLYVQSLPQALLKVLSIPHLVLEQARENSHKRLLIMGTQNTCRSDLYRHPEITMVYPSSKAQQAVDEVIDRVLEGTICQEDSALLAEVLATESKRQAFDGIVLGCTDLPVLHHRFPIASGKPLYDSIKIPAKILIQINERFV